eukprot:EG_transcript_1456
MENLRASVSLFSIHAERAAGAAREVSACLDAKQGMEDMTVLKAACDKLKLAKENVIDKWMKAVKGTVQRHTIFGTDLKSRTLYAELFDALTATLKSRANPPNDAQLVSFFGSHVRETLADQCRSDTLAAILLFEEAAGTVLKDFVTEPSDVVKLERAMGQVLLRAEACLNSASARGKIQESPDLTMLVAEARVAFGDARDLVLKALDNVRDSIPRSVPFQGLEDIAALRQMTEKTIALEQIAERLQALSSQVAPDAAADRAAHENKRHDIRVALVSLLRQKHEELSKRWMQMIVQRVPSYRGPDSDQPNTPKKGPSEQVSREVNQRLVNAMIERLRPGGDSSALVYAAQQLVELRFETMQIDSVQAATKLFEDTSIELYHELAQKGPYSRDLLPLIHADESDVRSMLSEVIFLGNKLIISEYKIRATKDQDPRLPSKMLRPEGVDVPDHEITTRIPELLMGAEIAGQYRLNTYIMAGGFGHGWKGTDLISGREVFVKTFKSAEEFPVGAENVKAGMVTELETAERIAKVQRLMEHPNVVSVLKVPRNAMITVPATGQSAACFHGIVTEYCDGGELFNYLVVPCESGGLRGMQFKEKQARYLFKQIVDLLMVLHHPKEGEGDAYYHGDIKDQNFVVSGSTLKLIDYGTLSKVSDHVGPVKHMTRSHVQPFHNNCESVDLWAAGIILMDMLVIGTIGQVFQMKMGVNRGCAALRDGTFWDSLDEKLSEQDPKNCLRRTGPDSVRDLLQKIFVTEPKNSLSTKVIAAHPWLQGPVPTPEEVETELKSRFQGIQKGAPRGTAFFDLGNVDDEEAMLIMEDVIDAVSAASGGEFVRAGPGPKEGSVYIHRWEKSERTTEGEAASFERMYADEAQWVVAKYQVYIEKMDYDISKGREVTRLCLFWESGSEHEDFCRLSSAMLNEVMKMQLF